jgi:hypothetical protein
MQGSMLKLEKERLPAFHPTDQSAAVVPESNRRLE